jgi:hypothetical protein
LKIHRQGLLPLDESGAAQSQIRLGGFPRHEDENSSTYMPQLSADDASAIQARFSIDLVPSSHV